MRTLVVDRSTRHGFVLLMPGSLMVTGVLDVTLANDVMLMFLAPFYASRQWCKALPLQLLSFDFMFSILQKTHPHYLVNRVEVVCIVVL
ncbi:unnamed protein product [Brassica rapa subsp. trilocularis]